MNQEKEKKLKEVLYSGILCDVLDGMGYRNQSIGMVMKPLLDETVIFGLVLAQRFIPSLKIHLSHSAGW